MVKSDQINNASVHDVDKFQSLQSIFLWILLGIYCLLFVYTYRNSYSDHFKIVQYYTTDKNKMLLNLTIHNKTKVKLDLQPTENALKIRQNFLSSQGKKFCLKNFTSPAKGITLTKGIEIAYNLIRKTRRSHLRAF